MDKEIILQRIHIIEDKLKWVQHRERSDLIAQLKIQYYLLSLTKEEHNEKALQQN